MKLPKLPTELPKLPIPRGLQWAGRGRQAVMAAKFALKKLLADPKRQDDSAKLLAIALIGVGKAAAISPKVKNDPALLGLCEKLQHDPDYRHSMGMVLVQQHETALDVLDIGLSQIDPTEYVQSAAIKGLKKLPLDKLPFVGGEIEKFIAGQDDRFPFERIDQLMEKLNTLVDEVQAAHVVASNPELQKILQQHGSAKPATP